MTVETNQSIALPIEGMDSEHCALIIDKGLQAAAEITGYKVELNNKRVIIESNDIPQAIVAAVKVVRGLGYQVPTVTKTFPILNMSCASCASSSQRMLEHQSGVVLVSVNYANAMVTIEYVVGVANALQLKSALQSIGYDLMIDESEEARESLEAIEAKHLRSLKYRTLMAVSLSVPLMAIGMFFMDIPYANYLMWALSSPVVVWLGRQFFVNAWKQAKHRSANMDTLVALSTGVAYLFSVFNTIYPEYWHQRGLHAHVYFETAAVVIAFILLGKLLEERAKGNTSSALKKLMGLQPKTVTVMHHGGHQMEIPLVDVNVGDTLLVKPGERVAVDGIVSSGHSFVDESMISGEPIPVEKSEKDSVFAGTINQKGSFFFTANKVGGDTVLAHIIKMVQDAQGSKAPVQKSVDRIAGIFVPVVMVLALITLGLWILLGGENGVTQGLMAMVTVLVIACPCALGLATPTAIMVGVGKGAANGILIKDAESLERAQKITAIVLDKTGTITEGKPEVSHIRWLSGDDSLSNVLAAIEQQSEHPLADAVSKHLGVSPNVSVSHFESITGLGARAAVLGETYIVGNAALMQASNIEIEISLQSLADQWLQQAQTVVFFADTKQALAVIAIADKIKSTTAEAVKQLQDAGIKVYMITGDYETTANVVAKQVGITQYKAGVLPAQKAAFVTELQQQGNVVAMVGDGINDSSALAQADVSIAMGKGSDIAMDVAKMTIISSDLSKIPQAIRLSKQTVATIRQNLCWAFVYNIIGIPIAAGVLFPINGFLLDPMIAGGAMALSSVSVVSNSLWLKFKK